ncbi:hypothetical protein EJB05_38005, partial [Eragrostis curvula]
MRHCAPALLSTVDWWTVASASVHEPGPPISWITKTLALSMVARHRHTCSSSSKASILEFDSLTISGTELPSLSLSTQYCDMAFSRSMPSDRRATSWLTVSRSLPRTYAPFAAVSSCSRSRSKDPVLLDLVFFVIRFLSAIGHSPAAAGPTMRPKNSRCAAAATAATAAALHATTRPTFRSFLIAFTTLSFLATFLVDCKRSACTGTVHRLVVALGALDVPEKINAHLRGLGAGVEVSGHCNLNLWRISTSLHRHVLKMRLHFFLTPLFV